MRDEFIRRTLVSIPQLLLISFITFLLIDLAPGDVLARYRFDPRIRPETIKQIEAKYHFDKPIIVQYGHWLTRLVRLDLGYSFSRDAPVINVIVERLFNTFVLSFFTIIFTWLIAILLGIYAAVKQYSIGDWIMSFISYFGMSLPTFFIALVFMFLIFQLRNYPIIGSIPLGGMISANYENLSLFR